MTRPPKTLLLTILDSVSTKVATKRDRDLLADRYLRKSVVFAFVELRGIYFAPLCSRPVDRGGH